MPGRIGFDWRRATRWCLIGVIVMLGWLLWPTARCSWSAYMATPISDLDPNSSAPAESDSSRVDAGKGFVEELSSAVKQCYAKTPLLGQESWKSTLLFAFGVLGAAAYAMGRITAKRQTYV